MSSKECGVTATIPKVLGTNCASRRHFEGRLRSLCSIHWTGLICITNDGRRSNGCHCSTTWMRWSSSRRNISLLVKMEDAPRLLKIQKSECPDLWMRLPKHKWPKSWNNIEDPVVPLERNLHGHPLAGLLWERQFAEVIDGTWNGEKWQIDNAFSCAQKNKSFSYRSMWMTLKWLQGGRI